jgi:hypothetical protein
MPTFSLVMTINDRTAPVLAKVFESIPEGAVDQIVVVFDRTPPALRAWVSDQMTMRGDAWTPVGIEGPPGWLCPVNAWNAGFRAVESEYAICFSSEVIWGPGAIEALKRRLTGQPCVVYGKCRDSGELGPVTNNPKDTLLLCSADAPRPLGFIYGLPTWALRATGGMDPAFMGGYWYDDDDWCMRLWALGLPFVFTDDVEGTHQAHARSTLETPEGLKGIERNHAVMIEKWGTAKPWEVAPKAWAKKPGLTVAVPTDMTLLFKAWEPLCSTT